MVNVTKTNITAQVSENKVTATVSSGVGATGSSSWNDILDRPTAFPPTTHQHVAADIADFTTAVVAAAPPTTNASLLTSGTLSDALLSANIARAADVNTALDAKAAVSHAHGNVTADGRIGTTSGLLVVTGAGGALTTAATVSAASVSGLAASATTDTTNAANISDGTLPSGRLPLATTNTRGAIIVGSGLTVASGTVSANVTSVAGRSGAVTLSKSDVGLGNVPNVDATARANHTGTQAISTVSGLQAALDAKATPADVSSAVSALVNSAPSTLDTLKELADALGSDANFSTTVTNALAGKAAATHAAQHGASGSDPITVSASQVTGLGSLATQSSVSYSDLANKPTLFDGAYSSLSGVPSTFTPPAASATVLGGVKVGSGLAIDGSSVLSATYSYTLPAATTSTLGGVIVGTGLGVSTGTVSVTYGTTSGTACQGNDSRLGDTRTPTDGSVTDAKITSGGLSASSINWTAIAAWAPSTAYAKGDLVEYLGIAYRRSAAGTSGTTFNVTNWQQVTPTSFVASQIASGTISTARLGSGTASSTTFLRGDNTWAAAGSTNASDLTSGTLAYARMADPTVTSPSQITGSSNDYSSFARGINRFTTNGAYNLTGMTAGNDGEVRVLTNVGTTAANTLTIKDQSSSSTAANRFTVPWSGDLVIGAGDSVVVYYDATTARWRVV